MGKYDFGGEQPQNYEQKCPCLLVLDTSGSMSGDPIRDLNAGLSVLLQAVKDDPIALQRLEIGVITFDSKVKPVLEFSLPAGIELSVLEATGSTKLVDGVREGIRMIDARKNWYRDSGQPYYRPYLILITDGAPDEDQDVEGLKREIQSGVEGKHFEFWPFGVGRANMALLASLNPKNAPLVIKDADFKGFFKWLSASMAQVVRSRPGDKVDLSPKKLLPEKPDIFQHSVS